MALSPTIDPSPTVRTLSNDIQLHVQDLQGDSGANCHATNQRHYLWDFRHTSPLPINTFDAGDNNQTSLQATGTGILRLVSDTNAIIDCHMLYIPFATGTVISPDKLMIDQNAGTFVQEGHRNGNGKMQWLSKAGHEITSLTLHRKRGLWYITNPILLPHHPSPLPTIRKVTSTHIQDLVLWHHRMGHPSFDTLRQTQKVVHGIPTIPATVNIPFDCPSCNLSKMTKSNTGPPSSRQPFKNGTMFHMDFGFIRGLSNLPEVLHGKKSTSLKTQSLDGATAYLLIIDAKSRFVWTFPVATKHPPINLIDKFLSRFGNLIRPKITTEPTNLLSQSKTWRKICQLHSYEPAIHSLAATAPSDTNIIRTDNGLELAGSSDFRRVANNHDYIVETTAPEASYQNGLAERPHRTLKEKVRCLLYSAGLATDFWSYALLHATWLYNRTYHRAIQSTPFEQWTKIKPTLNGLLTFGSTIVAKKPKLRPSALDLNAYRGIFLGYRATCDNILFYDLLRYCLSTARHFTSDEYQFASPSTDRSPAATSLLSSHLPPDQAPDVTAIPPSATHHWHVDDSPRPIHEEILCQTPPAVNVMMANDSFDLWQAVQQVDFTLNPNGPSVSEPLPVQGRHPSLGLVCEQHPEYDGMVILSSLQPGSIAHKTIKNWRTRLKGAIIASIDGSSVTSLDDVHHLIQSSRQKNHPRLVVEFHQPLWSDTSGEGIPQLHFDQLNVIHHILQSLQCLSDLPTPSPDLPLIYQLSPSNIHPSIHKAAKKSPKLRRSQLMKQSDWPKFQASEYVQLDKYAIQGMFGDPIPRPSPTSEDPSPLILDWVWAYCYKLDPVTLEEKPKSRGTCNGSRISDLAETFASCLEQTIHRLFWALVAIKNIYCIGCDVTNAFGEAPKPARPFYMRVDQPFRDWWTHYLHRDPIPPGYVIPVEKNLQGHPEAPRQWNRHITSIIVDKMGFRATTQEPCLYFGTRDNCLVLILRQIDDFFVAAATETLCQMVRTEIGSYMSNPMHDLGVVIRFNGLDILQTHHFIKLSAHTYISKLVENHGWQSLPVANLPVPMWSDPPFHRQLDTQEGPSDMDDRMNLEKQMGFSYRQVIGELIFALTTCRPDISAATLKLAQYSESPAKIHYQAAKAVLLYLYATRDHGLYFWRSEPNQLLPIHSLPSPITANRRLQEFPHMDQLHI